MQKLDVIFKLTEARLALAEGVMGLAKDKFEEVLAMDPENAEAKEFLENYEKGEFPDKPKVISLETVASSEPHRADGVKMVKKSISVPKSTKAREVRQDYSIDEIFIMTKEGLLVAHFTKEGSLVVDEDIITGMLAAIQMFIIEAFNNHNVKLRQIFLNEFDVVISAGEYISICAIVSGPKAMDVRGQVDRFVRDAERTYGDKFKEWKGNLRDMRGLQTMILRLITGGYI
jgi:hypothetical protein